MTSAPMVRLTTVSGQFAAHVLAARLDDEGFDVQLRGGLHTPYPLAMGGMGNVDVYVPADQVEEASYVLLVNEIDRTLDEEPEERHRRVVRRIAWPWRAVAAAVLLAAPVAACTYLAVGGTSGHTHPTTPSLVPAGR
jgi:hypothetical protein